ncbi:MAG TPA: TonB-dependent receptor [Rhizomicrobium sp.]|nr:TonB-dependent receptor [Rhizomicrobium sp.]
MNRLSYLKSVLAGGASAMVLATSAAASQYNIPSGDLKAALHAYSTQSGIPLIASDEAVKGARTRGAQGELTATAALSRILAGTGFGMQRDESGAVAIVREAPARQLVEAPRTIAAASAAESGIESVVVTSSKIKGDIQTVPIAITALSQEQLTARQIAGGPDLVKEVPNLTFSKTNFTGYNIQIRGIGTQAISVTTDPAVAVAFNDTPFIRNHFFEQEFFDVSQVEVLRGPQGTLYGRNATAGVVNVVSAKPTDQFEAMASADIGNYHNRRYEGMVNIPIVGDTLDLRVAGEWTKRDGYSFNTLTNQPIDGRDLWSTRVTIGWKPVEDVQAYLIWEHFQENDDRLRSAKQLCKTAPTPSKIGGVDIGVPGPVGNIGGFPYADEFSQGCLPTSLYGPEAFEVPNGFSLPYFLALGRPNGVNTANGGGGLVDGTIDPYLSTVQSRNLRDIESAINPVYRAKNDTLEFNAEYAFTPALTFTSQTGFNNDFLFSTEDYNRFNTSPGIFVPNSSTTLYSQIIDANGYFCDPQVGCANRLVAEDQSDEHAWQLSQEFRLSSNYSGPLNFSVGGNYEHYETEENYYVFINALTLVAAGPVFTPVSDIGPWMPGVSDAHECLRYGHQYNDPSKGGGALDCVYIDPNPIGRTNNEGHNYFLSQNPYVLNSYAGFGEVYYNVSPDLKLTGGLRWTDDEKHFINIPSQVLTIGYGYPSTGDLNQKWNQWTGRFAANWSPKLDFTDQTLLYGSFAHGYKAGGANPPGAVLLTFGSGDIGNPIHPKTFKPEFIDAYELGTKNTLLDGALTLNGDMFFYNYKGYQISEIVDRTSINLNFDATVRGAELEATWEAAPGLKFAFAGGYEATRMANGSKAVDLMDRTAGNPDWVVMRPDVTQASNCVMPIYVVVTFSASCGDAYSNHVDPLTHLPYHDHPDTCANADGLFPGPCDLHGYPGFDPVDPNATNNGAGPAPNNGAGFDKNLSGNQLPNAPHFTTSFTADYTMPVSENWAATLHGDFYWQSQSYARVFNDRPYDKIRGYSTVNTALILTDASGWQVMGYVKNIFNATAITGDFLNSDDTGLTTNVFLTDPRLYGVRITKHFDGGADDGFDLFGSAANGRPQVWLTLGGDFARLADGWQKFDPLFVSTLSPAFPSPLKAEQGPRTSFDWKGKLSYQPEDSDWVLKAGIRYGKSANNHNVHKSLPVQTANLVTFPPYLAQAFGIPTTATCDQLAAVEARFGGHLNCPFAEGAYRDFLDIHASSSEKHEVLDFTLGKDVGIGLFGHDGKGTVGAGMRIAQFDTRAHSELNSDPHFNFPKTLTPFTGGRALKYGNLYDDITREQRSFHGIGPEITWDANQQVWGNEHDGEVTIDWGVNAAMLFGRQRANIQQSLFGEKFGVSNNLTIHYDTTPPAITRSRSVTVPNLGGYAGLSMRYNDAKVSFGYRADEFFGAMDGGQDTAKKYNRGFFGPYLNLSLGFGG